MEAVRRTLNVAIDSVLAARPKRYVMLNARDERLAEVLALLPGLDAPTVLPLARNFTASASALSYESPREPTEPTAPASASRSV